MKLTTLLTFGLLLPLSLSAQQRTNTAILSDARQAVMQHLGATSAQLSTMKVVDNVGQIAIVSSPEAGTAFVSRAKNYDRVIGCSATAYTAGHALPCGLQLWLEAANQKISTADAVNPIATTKASDVESFITTTWSQEDPYNSLCPLSGDTRCMSGCVATAMAQVMNYFEYPARSTGKVTYYVKQGSAAKTYTANLFSFYDWTNMPDVLLSRSSTDREIKAVATLMRDCGYATYMYYTTDGSGTSDFYVPSALSTYFAYDSLSVNYLQHEYCTEEEWYGTIYSELAAKRPILFSGQSATQGGHAFVFDGMSSDGTVHINWGWAGYMDGYYDPAVMDPSADFTLSQSIVYGFNPQATPAEPTEYPDTHIVIDSPNLSTDAGQLNLAATVMNVDWRNFVGDIVYCVIDPTNEENSYSLAFMVAPEEGEEATELPGGAGWQFTSASPLNFNEYFKEEGDDATDFVFPAGEYDVYILYQGIHDAESKYVTTNGGEPWIKGITVASDGTITIGESTAIKKVLTDETKQTSTNGQAYDLSGRPVSKTAKGIIIVGGKKLLRR